MQTAEIAMANRKQHIDNMASTGEIDVHKELLKHKKQIFMICLGFSPTEQDAEDLTHETILKALEMQNTVVRKELFKPWILRITRNMCIDHYRRHKVRQRFVPQMDFETKGIESPEDNHSREQEMDLIRKAISQLPTKLKDVLVMREFAELSYQEISEVLNIKEGTVMSRLNRGRQKVLHWIKGVSK